MEKTKKVGILPVEIYMSEMFRNCFFLALLTGLFFLTGQESKAQSFDSVLGKLDESYPQEKIYVQYDRDLYNPGETIWFKAYIFSGFSPSQISNTLYAEMYSGDGKLIDRKTIPVIQAGAASSFDIPAGITGRVVYIRVYSRWMLNFDSSFIYTKAIPLINPDAGKTGLVKSNDPDILQFFPEGGDMVTGIESRIAYKATDAHGLPIKISGNIVNRKGEKVLDFSGMHDGMGYFRLTPAAGEEYRAIWKDTRGKTIQTTLPAPKKNGLVMELNQYPRGIAFQVRRPEPEEGNPPYIYVVAQIQQHLIYRAKASLSNSPVISGLIPAEGLPAGIVQVTLFTPDEKPVAERIVFVNHQDYYFITDLNSAVKGTGPKQKNVIQVDVPDSIAGNLSISVTDAGLDQVLKNQDNIFSHLLLTGDIKGYVHNPAYYFSSEADSVAKHLDLVMMTNGWRRFRWEEVLAGKWPEIRELPDNFITLQGTVSGLNKSELQQKELLGFFAFGNGNQQMMNIPVNNEGKFFVPGLVFFDSARLYYQFNNDKDKLISSRALVDIRTSLLSGLPKVNPPDSELVHRAEWPDSLLAGRSREVFRKQLAELNDAFKKAKVLETVTVIAKQKSKKEQMDEQYTSGFFKGGDGYSFITEDDPFANSAMSVLRYLQGKVPGLQIYVNGTNASLSWRGSTPTLYLNEMQGDINMIESLSMSDIAMIKVYRPPFFGSFGGGTGGAIAVYTKKGKVANSRDVKGLDFARLNGYSTLRQFYSPDYSNPEDGVGKNDYRSTLYWNPYVFTDATNRRIYLTFFNNDITRRFHVVIEGISADGKLTRMEKYFE